VTVWQKDIVSPDVAPATDTKTTTMRFRFPEATVRLESVRVEAAFPAVSPETEES